MGVYGPSLGREQAHCYAIEARKHAGCDEACDVRVIGLPDDDESQIMIIVAHRRGDEAYHVKRGRLPLHQGLDPEVLDAMKEIGAVIAPLHGDERPGGKPCSQPSSRS